MYIRTHISIMEMEIWGIINYYFTICRYIEMYLLNHSTFYYLNVLEGCLYRILRN